MKYIIIGLGNYGGGLAEELMAIGHEVIGVDQNEGRVDNLKDKITTCWMQRMNWLWKLCHSERSMW
jgi:trk system potassium uptake protein TrkA